jgi:ribonuclease-3
MRLRREKPAPLPEGPVLGWDFSDRGLLLVALTTPACRMTTPGVKDNQRLEFLGDAVLGMLAADWLYAKSPSAREGELTARRQHMVSTAALAAAAEKAGLQDILRLNKGANGVPSGSKTLADAVEAVIGAAWLDGGLAAARAVFDFLGLAENSRFGELDGNPKTHLQHIAQAMTPVRVPVYEVINVAGTANRPEYTVRVVVEGMGEAVGRAGSKKEAEAAAAEALVESVRTAVRRP